MVGFYLLLGLDVPNLKNPKSLSVTRLIASGFFYLRTHPKVVHLILLHASVGLSAYDALIALLADYQYKEIYSVALVMGLMNATRAVSLFFGQIILGRYVNPKMLFFLFIAQGIAILVWGVLQRDFHLSLVGIFLCGLFSSTIWSYTYTLLQQETQEAYYGRVVAYNDMALTGVSTIMSFAIGFLFEAGIALWMITCCLGVGFICFGFYWRFIERLR